LRFALCRKAMNSLLYVDVNVEQLKRLEEVDDVVTAKQLLSAMFGVPQDPSQEWRTGEDSLQYIKDEPMWAILSDLYFYAFVFTKDQRFTRPKTSAFMAILKKVVETDINTMDPNMKGSFTFFKKQLFSHSVERHPHSAKIFEPADAKLILQYMTDSYYRHFKLYQYNFTRRQKVTLVQTSSSCVETMRAWRPLSQAMPVAMKVPNQHEQEGPACDDAAAAQLSATATPSFTSSATIVQEKPVLMSSASMPVMTSSSVAGAPSNAARAKKQARERLKMKLRADNKASADMRWQYRWTCHSKNVWGTYNMAVTNSIEQAFISQQDTVVDVGGGSFKLFKINLLCLMNETNGEQVQIRRLDPCPAIALRKEGQLAKVQSQLATDLAYTAVGGAFDSIGAAEKHILIARRRKAVMSCSLKLMLIYRNLRVRMRVELMRNIQARVVALMADNEWGVDCTLVEVDLIHSQVKIKEQVKFEGGKAVIKPESDGLMLQVSVCKKCISQTCKEFKVDNMHWRVEGHTAVSKKSKDGGRQTSSDRAKAVCEFLKLKGIDTSYLHPEGCGCFSPPADPKADPRRVEIHVMDPQEVARSKQRKKSYADIAGN